MSSELRARADQATKKVREILKVPATEPSLKLVMGVIEHAMIETVLAERERCADVAAHSCGKHIKVGARAAAQIREGADALLANLSSLR